MNSTLDPDNDPSQQPAAPGHDTESLGPGDSSDSGSDRVGAKRHDFDRDTELDNHALEAGPDEAQSDTDSSGTGERASADGDESLRPDSDVLPDEIEEDVQEGADEDEDAQEGANEDEGQDEDEGRT
ncbi:chemotaxis protein [Paraburkholderia tagetis]|uniref:Chemotaxis protein n=1 Tax=Paraburkholderia tagetis TaxID=2913261 RepID=A0A9X1UKP0_9BURK|nr:chemotaxis protein [Paraburkholderia tagetis]MCG5075131.1 chemotaxis protein [Paraburkholderia tagetis]